MVSLADSCSLDISFDANNNAIFYGSGVAPRSRTRVTLKNLIPGLLNQALHYPEVVYEEHNQVFHEADQALACAGLSFDVLCLPAGLLGVEFIKSHIFYAPEQDHTFSTIVEVHLGILTIIMQKNAPKAEFEMHSSVVDGVIVKLKKGEKLAIPTGYFYTFINTEDIPVLFVRVHRKNGVVDYTLLRRERGLAYYCIRKNARQEIVHNPIYRVVPHIRELAANAFLDELGLHDDSALYTQLRKHTSNMIDALWC